MAARTQLLVFDFDGTLVDTSLDLAAATNHAMREMGFPARDVEEIRAFVGDGARKLVERALPPGRESLIERGVQIFLDYYEKHLLDRTRPYEGIPEMLEALAGVPKAIATNKPERFTREIVDGLGWQRLFAHIVGGDSLPVRKPDGAVVRSICDRLAISPAGTLVVGDGPQDVGAAHAAGARCCSVAWGFRGPALLKEAGADFLISHPLELVQMM